LSATDLFLCDSHVHTRFSADADTPLEKVCRQALLLGLRAVCITDHVSFWAGDRNFPPFDYRSFKRAIDRCRDRFGHRLTILMGVEVDYHSEHEAQIADYLADKPFDFVLGSLHYLNGRHLLTEECFSQFADLRTLMASYVEAVHEMVASELFDAIAHLDWIKRGWHQYVDPATADGCLLTYAAREVEDLLEAVRESNIALELNASGYRRNVGQPFPNREILVRYREAGGRLITVGSDAHRLPELAYAVAEALELALSVGFEEVTVYRERQPISIPIRAYEGDPLRDWAPAGRPQLEPL